MNRGGLVRLGVLAGAVLLAAAALAVRSTGGASSPGGSVAVESVPDESPALAPSLSPDDVKGFEPAGPPLGAGAGDAGEVLVFLRPGQDPAAWAAEHGLVHQATLRSDPDAHVFGAADARGHREKARGDRRVRRAYLNERLQRKHCAFVSDDPFFNNDNNPAGFPGQWHLGNGATATHANVVAAWARDITGTGVIIGIVDDGLETAHPDLSANYVAADSWDFGGNDSDPNPFRSNDDHGTSVSGVAGARGGNGLGVSGAAPLAGLAGLRIDFQTQTTAMFVDATQYHSSGGNTNVKVKNHSYGYSAPYIDSQAERDAVGVSAAAGTIHCFAAGNERGGTGQDSNKQDVQSSPDVIAVAALGSNGTYSSYSSFGANVFVTAPSNTSGGYGITTTDRTGNPGYNGPGSNDDAFPNLDYTSRFGGTSSATPLAVGILALAKQVQPALDIRFAKHLLVRSSVQVDPNDSTVTGGGDGVTAGSAWKTNAAGRKFNQNYGFGKIDADALCQQAVLYSGVTALQQESTGTIVVGAAIPDNNATGVSRTFAIGSTTPLEEMLVTMNATHTWRGDLEIFLTSPSGTTCRLAYRSGGDSADNINWTFVSNAFWGENPAGTWTLTVKDVFAPDTGTWTSFAVTARMGQLVLSTTPPTVSSILRAGADPTNASSVAFTVTFSESVTGVDASDFALTASGVSGASVSGVSGTGAVYTVTVNTGTGSGTLRLDVVDNDSILDLSSTPLGGAGAGNGSYASGQSYTIDKTAPGLADVTSTTANGAYGSGAAVNVTVDFTEPVTLAGGNLQVTLSTGDVVSIAPFGPALSASGTYVVSAGDNSPDLDSNSPLSLSAGTLRDAAGNACGLAIPLTQNLAALKAIVIDTTAPQTTIATGPSGSVASTSATFTFSASEAVLRYETRLDGGAWTNNLTGTVTYNGLSQGLHSFDVRAVDLAGNVDASPASSGWTVDTVAPDTTILTGPSGPTPSASATFTFSSGEPVLRFEVNLDGAGFVTNGTSTSVIYNGLSQGGHTFEARAVDLAGNTDLTPASRAWTVDTLAPDTSVDSGPMGTVATGDATFTFSSPDLTARFDVRLDGGAWSDNGMSTSKSYLGLPDGSHTFEVRAVDPAGNPDPTPASQTWTVDTGFPDTSILTGPPAVTTSTSATFTFSATEAVLRYEVQLDAGGFISNGTSTTVTYNMLSEGAHTFQVRAVDLSSNTDPSPASQAWTVDMTAPNTTIVTGPSGPSASTSATFTFSSTESVLRYDVQIDGGGFVSNGTSTSVTYNGLTQAPHTFDVRAVDLAGNVDATPASRSWTVDTVLPNTTIDSGPATVSPLTSATFAYSSNETALRFEVRLDGGVWTNEATGSVTYNSLSQGAHTFDVRAVDLAGNVDATPASQTWTVDTAAPNTTIATGPSGNWPSSSATFTFSSNEAVLRYEVRLEGAGPWTDNGSTASVTFNGLSEGAHTFEVRAVDLAGNTDPTPASRAWTVDTVAPNTTILTGPTGPTASTTAMFTFSSSETVLRYDVQLDDGGWVDNGTTTSVTYNGLTQGSHSFQVRAVDAAGNVDPTPASQGWSVDTAAPDTTILTGPNGPTASTSATFTFTSSEAVLRYDVRLDGAAGWSDNGTSPTVTYNGLSQGAHTFEVRAVDSLGNVDPTPASRAWTVDTVAPSVSGVSSPTANGFYDASDAITVTVTFSEAVLVTGSPRLTLETGAADANATYSGGSGTATLSFLYTVAAGHESPDLDYASTTALGLNGGTIRDAAGNNATLTLASPGAAGSLGAAKAIVVDTTGPGAGTVSDGWSGGDIDAQTSRTTLSAHWTGFSDAQSGIAQYEWAIGTSSGGAEVRAFTSVGLRTAASTSSANLTLALAAGTYYVTVRATNGAGLSTSVTSDGVTVGGADDTPPPAVPWFVAVGADASAILEWEPVADAASYTVWWKPAASPWTSANRVDALPGPAATVLGLTNGVLHDFLLRAVDSSGNESPGIFASATPRPAITIDGSGSYPTIQDAINNAGLGDTVEVGPGTYAGDIVLAPGVSLCGASARHTILTGSGTGDVIAVLGASSQTICDLTVRNGVVGVNAGTSNLLLLRVVVHGMTSHGVTSAGAIQAVNCTLMSNGGDGVRALGTASLRNCVSGRNGGIGVNLPSGSPATYTSSFANGGAEFAAGVSGTGSDTKAAVFTDEAGGDYTEDGLSPTVDSGDPADAFAVEPAPNGARVNRAAFGNTPWAASRGSAPRRGGGGGGGGGGGCGSTGLDLLWPLGLLVLGRRRAVRRP